MKPSKPQDARLLSTPCRGSDSQDLQIRPLTKVRIWYYAVGGRVKIVVH